MLEEDHEWAVPFYGCYEGCYSGMNSYYLGEATMIDNKIYYPVNDDFCYLREENGLVYGLYNNEELLIYDFTLELGDNFTLEYGDDYYCSSLNLGSPVNYTVSAVYNILLAGQDRKVIELESENFPVVELWIEGIGSNRGLFPYGLDYHTGSELACFTEDGVTYFFNDYKKCEARLGIESYNLDQIVLSPNPVSDTSILQVPFEASVDVVKFFEITGRLIKEFKVTSENVQISTSDYTSGIYFYQVFSEEKLLKTEKFIIN